MITDREFAERLEEILSLGYETSGIECKGPGPMSGRQLLPQVLRAVLGMSNRGNGGWVIIGVEDTGNSLNPVGLSDNDLTTWRYDHFSDHLAVYADPSVSFDLEVKEHQGKKYVVLDVHEFEQIPILCKRSYAVSGNVVLREGACYVRSRTKPETKEVSTQEAMRDLLELAADKEIARFFARLRRVGFLPPPAPSPTDQERFDEQLGDLR